MSRLASAFARSPGWPCDEADLGSSVWSRWMCSRTWAVQDSPPGAAAAALVARGDVEVGWLDRAIYEERTVVALYNARSATAVLPADEAAAYGTAQLPVDDDGLKALRRPRGARARRGLRRAGRARVRRDLARLWTGIELQPRRPARAATPDAPGSAPAVVRELPSHHARRGLLIVAGLRGRLCISGRAGRQPVFARDGSARRLGRRRPAGGRRRSCVLRRYRRDVRRPGRRTTSPSGRASGARTRDGAVGCSPSPHGTQPSARPRLKGVPPDRLRRPDPARPRPRGAGARSRVRARDLGVARRAGVVLVDGEVEGLWRGRKRGKVLDVTLEGDTARPPCARRPSGSRRTGLHVGEHPHLVRMPPLHQPSAVAAGLS